MNKPKEYLQVLNGGLINEPTAAALAYSLQVPPGQQNTVLVFDLGGGTFDVSVVSVDGVAVEVKCTGGTLIPPPTPLL